MGGGGDRNLLNAQMVKGLAACTDPEFFRGWGGGPASDQGGPPKYYHFKTDKMENFTCLVGNNVYFFLSKDCFYISPFVKVMLRRGGGLVPCSGSMHELLLTVEY